MTEDVDYVGTTIGDLSQRLIHIDDKFCEIVGRERDSLIGQQALSITYGDDLALNQRALDRLAADGPGFSIIKRYVRGDGSLIWVENHATRIPNGSGGSLLCTTTHPIDHSFEEKRLTDNYKAAQRLVGVLAEGRREFTPDLIWAPAVEALLWLYHAEIEGRSPDVDELTDKTGAASSVMLRWVKLLLERGLVVMERPGPLSGRTHLRISASSEEKLNNLLAKLTS